MAEGCALVSVGTFLAARAMVPHVPSPSAPKTPRICRYLLHERLHAHVDHLVVAPILSGVIFSLNCILIPRRKKNPAGAAVLPVNQSVPPAGDSWVGIA